jgi:hypothetical protein
VFGVRCAVVVVVVDLVDVDLVALAPKKKGERVVVVVVGGGGGPLLLPQKSLITQGM